MLNDRMIRMACIALMALGLAAGGAIGVLRPATAEAAKTCTVPASWGPLKAIAPGNSAAVPVLFAFEDASGTVRVAAAGCKSGYAIYEVQRGD